MQMSTFDLVSAFQTQHLSIPCFSLLPKKKSVPLPLENKCVCIEQNVHLPAVHKPPIVSERNQINPIYVWKNPYLPIRSF